MLIDLAGGAAQVGVGGDADAVLPLYLGGESDLLGTRITDAGVEIAAIVVKAAQRHRGSAAGRHQRDGIHPRAARGRLPLVENGPRKLNQPAFQCGGG